MREIIKQEVIDGEEVSPDIDFPLSIRTVIIVNSKNICLFFLLGMCLKSHMGQR